MTQTRHTIRTVNGIWVDPFDMNSEQVYINDIAHALARLCRFGGHTVGFHSVARHSVAVALKLKYASANEEVQLAGLLHDASEAYLVDVPRPIKHRPEMAGYREAEERVQRVIFERYALPWPMPEAVHLADDEVLQVELRHGRIVFNGTPNEDYADFLNLFKTLGGFRRG